MRFRTTPAPLSPQACFSALTSQCGSASATLSVSASPLVALLSGGNAEIGDRDAAAFDCSGSFDPDAPAAAPGKLNYTWACAAAGGGPCVGTDGSAVALVSGAATQVSEETAAPSSPGADVSLPPPLKLPLLEMQAIRLRGAASGARYTVSCTVSSGDRSATASGTVSVFSAALPTVTVNDLPAELVRVSFFRAVCEKRLRSCRSHSLGFAFCNLH